MNRLRQILVWIGRIHHCRGFGIQSPVDYRFVRYVINEHWPYYAYEQLSDSPNHWLAQKLGRFYLRLANDVQPQAVTDGVGAEAWIMAGCRRARITPHADEAQLIIVPASTSMEPLLAQCADNAVLVVQDIWQQRDVWQRVVTDARTTVTFDLYYCGVAFFDKKRPVKNYVINF